MAQATYVTKFDAGGSGDNVAPDGFIKSFERVWLDNYAFTAAIPSGRSVDIAFVPKNKKITDIEVYFPVLSTGASATGTTISLGTRVGTTTSTSVFLSAGEACAGIYTLRANLSTGLMQALDNDTYITMYFGRIATTTTAGTIRTVVRYT